MAIRRCTVELLIRQHVLSLIETFNEQLCGLYPHGVHEVRISIALPVQFTGSNRA